MLSSKIIKLGEGFLSLARNRRERGSSKRAHFGVATRYAGACAGEGEACVGVKKAAWPLPSNINNVCGDHRET